MKQKAGTNNQDDKLEVVNAKKHLGAADVHWSPTLSIIPLGKKNEKSKLRNLLENKRDKRNSKSGQNEEYDDFAVMEIVVQGQFW